MKTAILRAAVGAATLATGLASAQTYSAYPSRGYSGAPASLVRCESISSRTNFCRADTRGGVRIYRQLSRKDCIRGRNWRATPDGIIVDDGCRAEFAVASGYASVRGYDRYGRPIYDTRAGTYNGGYGNGGYGSGGYGSGGYGSGGYGNGGYNNGGYTYDRYGNRIYVGNTGSYGGGYYSTDRYGNRVQVDPYRNGNGGYYPTDRYGNRVHVDPYGHDGGGYYPTDQYGNRDYDDSGDTYRRNVELGPPGYGGGTHTAPATTHGTDVIHCTASPMGRTYCGDRTRTYTLRQDGNSNCVLNQTYGRDSYGTWVSGGCNMRLEGGGY